MHKGIKGVFSPAVWALGTMAAPILTPIGTQGHSQDFLKGGSQFSRMHTADPSSGGIANLLIYISDTLQHMIIHITLATSAL